MTHKTLGDELRAIERNKALPSWPESAAALGRWMKERAQGDYYAAVLVGYYTEQSKLLLCDWAHKEGLDATSSIGGLTRGIWLSWGLSPTITRGTDVELMPDGTLRWPDGKGRAQ